MPMLQSQQRLGDFEIIRLIGKGGMGEVYEAQQLNPPRPVAIKVLAPWLAGNEDSLQRFFRESAVPALLDHPNIVRIISSGKTDDGVAYYAMQLVRGISLAELIRSGNDAQAAGTMSELAHADETPSHGPSTAPASPPAVQPTKVPVQEYRGDRFHFTARIGAQAAGALADAHRQGYLHRDIKPANMMIDQHGHLYLLDFGLTRLRDTGAATTRPGVILGTPWYMSPEQARGETVDHRSDLYSLGVSLYQLLTSGVGPFTAPREDSEAVLTEVRGGTQIPLQMLAPGIPKELDRIITKSINPNPRNRYQKAEDLAADLQAYLGQAHASEAGFSRSRSHVNTVALPQKRWISLPSRKTLVRIGAGLLITAALVVGIISISSFLAPAANVVPHIIDKKPEPAAVTVALPEGALPYPAKLRELPPGFSHGLMNQDHQPLWHCKLEGTGNFRRADFQLFLNSFPGDDPTLLALDMRTDRGFEFAVELQTTKKDADSDHLGVFFGWRSHDKPFFVVEVDETPTPILPFGHAQLRMMRINKGAGAEKTFILQRAVPSPNATIPLPHKGWHRLVVRASRQHVTFSVDDARPCSIDMNTLREAHAEHADTDTRGAVGIWAWHAWAAAFRRATITPSAEGK